jgi:CubicO group peptidase (beta-lactamase class C family)
LIRDSVSSVLCALCASVVFLCSVARADELPASTPEAEGMSSDELVQLTTWIRDNPTAPVFSILISKNGKLVYELYTSSGRDEAHYLMSVTKSVLSALIGIAIERHLLPGTEAPIAALLPRAWFASDTELARFQKLTLKQVMGMQGLDAPDQPGVRTEKDLARYAKFWNAPNRVVVALTQPLFAGAFQYNDSTPALAGAALQWAAKKSTLAFAEENLFGPMGFRNYEWMHQDGVGMDNAGYGLRLRPVDMHKLGLLFLDGGAWHGRQLVPRAWVERSFQPWNKSKPDSAQLDYGWFWWHHDYGAGWNSHSAIGWKGQRIAVFPEQKMVVTMTGCIEDSSERAMFDDLVTKILMPSVKRGPTSKDPGALPKLLGQVRAGTPRFGDFIEYRMVPSVTPKMPRKPFVLQR